MELFNFYLNRLNSEDYFVQKEITLKLLPILKKNLCLWTKTYSSKAQSQT